MTKQEIANTYLSSLEKGDIDKIIDLFTKDGVVESPLYGRQLAKDFYPILFNDTTSSELKFDGLFIEDNSNRMSLLFDYVWVLKDGKKVNFKVVDVITLSPQNKIEKLVIIYDTIHTRVAVEGLKEK